MSDITEKDSEQDVKIAVLDSTLENATRRMELIHKRIDRTEERGCQDRSNPTGG